MVALTLVVFTGIWKWVVHLNHPTLSDFSAN